MHFQELQMQVYLLVMFYQPPVLWVSQPLVQQQIHVEHYHLEKFLDLQDLVLQYLLV